MRLSVISFTRRGAELCKRLVQQFRSRGEDCRGYINPCFCKDGNLEEGILPRTQTLSQWTERQFQTVDGLVFIGAAAIAVRSIAPYLKGKTEDPAVVVLDEAGQYSIALLSGHIGGANDLARTAAAFIGAEAVVTTATDINGVFAVDVFAAKQGLAISDMELAKQISARLLEGEPVGFFSDFPIEGDLPPQLVPGKRYAVNIWITVRGSQQKFPAAGEGQVLRLVPACVFLGIGCRKGVTADEIRQQIRAVLWEADLACESIKQLASVDIKAEEEGLLLFAEEEKLPFTVYPADRLLNVPGTFSESEFVRQTTGVGNICERAALCAALEQDPGSRLIMKKHAQGKVTAAAALCPWKGNI